jgi:hypothetical protein
MMDIGVAGALVPVLVVMVPLTHGKGNSVDIGMAGALVIIGK